MIFAFLTNGTVAEVRTVADADEITSEELARYQNVVDVTRYDPVPQVGWTSRDGGVTFLTPNGESAMLSKRVITKYAYRLRMTLPEKIAFEDVYVNSDHPLNRYIRVLYNDFLIGGNVGLDDPEVIEGTYLLELAGIIVPGRADEIISAPIQDWEKP